MKKSLPLRVSILVSLALLALTLTSIEVAHQWFTTRRSVEDLAVRRAASLGFLVAPAMERAASRDDRADIQEEVSRLALTPDVSLAAVVDDMGTVTASSDFTVQGRPLEARVPAAALALVDRARHSMTPVTEVSSDGTVVRSAASFLLALQTGELRPSRKAVLYTEMDLRASRREAMAALGQRVVIVAMITLLAGLVVWAYHRATFTRQFDELVKAATEYTAGGGDALRIPAEGDHELAQIGRVLNRMFEDLAARNEALRESEEKFTHVFRQAPIMMSLTDADTGRFLEVNEELVRAAGYSREELIGSNAVEREWVSVEDRERIRAAIRERGRVSGWELQFRRRNGDILYGLYSGESLTIGGQRCLLSTTLDVTEQKRAVDALRESEEQYHLLFEQMHSGFAILDVILDERGKPADHRLVSANAAFDTHTGLKRAEQIGRRSADLDVKWPPSILARYYDIALNGGAFQIDRYNESLNRYYDVRAFSPRKGQWAMIFSDITERHRAEEEQRRLQGLLAQAQKMEAIGTLAGGVAHDFNNILTAILVQVSLLQQEALLSPALRTGLADLEREASRAATLTRQLLLFSRRQNMEAKPLELNSTIGQLLRMLRRIIGEQISLEFNGAAGDLWIEGDPGMLEQVVMNLAVNARDAMPRGGRISLRTRMVDVDEASASRNPEARQGRFASLEVADEGHGFDEQTAARIFEPFFTTKEAGKGTGLGLATVYGIVRQHQGWIEFDSVVGHGTTFRVLFPVSRAADTPDAEILGEQVMKGGHERILLVEDETSVRRLLVRTLQKLGYQVDAAANGNEALERWHTCRDMVDLLITDLVMPGGMTGLELVERLLADRPDLRVIVMSGYSPDLADRDLLERSRILVLSKPLNVRVFAVSVRSALDRRQPV